MPEIAKSVFLAKGSIVTGDVTIGENCSVWYNAVVRGDEDTIVIGEGSNIQDLVMVHASGGSPCRIGKSVSVGHCAIVHGCEIGDNTLVGMGAILMNDAVIGKNCVIGAGALVTSGMRIPDGSVVIGNPAKVRRAVTDREIENNKNNADEYIRLAAKTKACYNEQS